MIKKKKKKSLKKFVFLGLFFCLAGGLAYFSIWSPFFWVKEIRIEAEDGKQMYYSSAEIEKIAKGILENKLFYFIPQKSIVLAPTEKIKEKILERFPEIKLVSVFKKAPSILEIKIKEREGVGIWCNYEKEKEESELRVNPAMTGEDNEILRSDLKKDQTLKSTNCDEDIERKIKDCFKIDAEGVIYRESPLIGGNLVLNIYSANSSAKIRDEVIPPETMNFILTVRKELSELKTAGRAFPEAISFEFVSVEELRAKIIQGWWIYFNPAVSAYSQVNTLKVALDNEIKEGLSSLEYIDLRIEGRVYYK